VRITFLVHQFPPRYFTGTEQYALGIGRELQRAGHTVDVFTLEPAFGEATGPWRESREVVDGLPVRRVNFWMNLGADWARMEYRHPLLAEQFGRHLREVGSDVVHSFHLRHLGADLLDQAWLQDRPSVVSLTDFWFLCPRVILMRRDGQPCDGPPDGGRGCLPCHAPELAADWAARPGDPGLARRVATHHERWPFLRERLARAAALVAPTRFLRDVFVGNGAPAARLHQLDYGVDAAALATAGATAAPARPLTFGFFGTFSAHKGPHVLVDALRTVRGDWRAVLRGRTSDFADYSAALATNAAAEPRIALLPPFDRHDRAAAFAAIDVLVVPSTWHENAPFVVLEARAAGLPVLASRFGGLAEVVADEVDGELFAPGDAEDLARRLQRLVDEPGRLARYRANVRPPKSLATAASEFAALYAEARR
jgi:glycosyltransferase involved in cell wall biosynthesis